MEREMMSLRPIWRYEGGDFTLRQDAVTTERPITVSIGGEEFATIVCTPIDIEELVIGFLASEGLIRTADELLSLQLDEGKGFAYIELANPGMLQLADHSKRLIGSCCGKSRQLYWRSDARTAKTIRSRDRLTPEQCVKLMRELQEHSVAFQLSGGVHNAALCTADELLLCRTDIGRHNALDKVYGHCLRHRVPMKGKVLAFSGRVSSEVLLKVSKMGIGTLLARSAPTELALQLAEDLGITVVGFLRGESFNVYTHPERLGLQAPM
ncbi:formate dehydrogenase accessory sulfurtransferase FdhD [Paenibacillus sp. GD4]|jgi:FdhD protein|uniref:formate dehydrogenase accessory sulfurtransferase FdhD n=1 Tax=Paenibacillus sp. GD4 TaxID=3068890 RepID=UPI0027964D7D|nr:formate dehydrogenase accessory sulfurtransferase FdhD [Paenibacillus sp. GD4]MDQ1912335.1 formate dehydrogenase accessory sulfurtransferase FdhD [Paenibacillus sp. GD4]